MVNDSVTEVIFVGLPGPTHHYGGLSEDNVASSTNRGSVSQPKLAALQALDLLRLLNSLGITTAILPPQLRPHIGMLSQRFHGDPEAIIRQALQEAPLLLEQASSASAMWTANAATVAPVPDTTDRKLHITTANLFTHPHRRIEAQETHRTLSTIFAKVPDSIVHPPLPDTLRDEGAANHMRLSPAHSAKGLQVFVYGDTPAARQSLAASQAVARQHQLPPQETLFVRQNPQVIAQGVFHNDVIAVSNESVLLLHESAYDAADVSRIETAYAALHPGKKLQLLIIKDSELSVAEAVGCYIFNSQIVTKPNGTMAIIAPAEVQNLYGGKAAKLLERIRADNRNPIHEVHYIDLRQSMRNGGGPACLRLRVPMTAAQCDAMAKHVNVLANETLLTAITQLIEAHYPAELRATDLGDPGLYHRCNALLKELYALMDLSF